MLITSLSWMLISCAPYGQNVNRNTNSNQNYPSPSDPIILAPGTVRVLAVVVDWIEKEQDHLCTFRIEETYEYGSATGKIYFVATSTGVYSTRQLNGSNTVWQQEAANTIGNTVVEDIKSIKADGQVVAGTHGRGIFAGELK